MAAAEEPRIGGAVIVCICRETDEVLVGRFSGLTTAYGSRRPPGAPNTAPRTIRNTNAQILQKMNEITAQPGQPALTLPGGLVAGSTERTLAQKINIRRHILTQMHARMPDNNQRIHIVHFLNANDNDFHFRNLYHAGHQLQITLPQGQRNNEDGLTNHANRMNTMQRCAQREFAEEVGVRFRANRFIHAGNADDYSIFRLCINLAERNLIIDNYNNGSGIVVRDGELNDPIPDIAAPANQVDRFKYGSELFNVNFILIDAFRAPTPPEEIRAAFSVNRDPDGTNPLVNLMVMSWGGKSNNIRFRQADIYNGCEVLPNPPGVAVVPNPAVIVYPAAPIATGGPGGPVPAATATGTGTSAPAPAPATAATTAASNERARRIAKLESLQSLFSNGKISKENVINQIRKLKYTNSNLSGYELQSILRKHEASSAAPAPGAANTIGDSSTAASIMSRGAVGGPGTEEARRHAATAVPATAPAAVGLAVPATAAGGPGTVTDPSAILLLTTAAQPFGRFVVQTITYPYLAIGNPFLQLHLQLRNNYFNILLQNRISPEIANKLAIIAYASSAMGNDAQTIGENIRAKVLFDTGDPGLAQYHGNLAINAYFPHLQRGGRSKSHKSTKKSRKQRKLYKRRNRTRKHK